MELCKSDIYFIILLIFNLFLFYKFYELKNITKENVKESFVVQDDVKAAINEVYQADVDAIRNLSAVATKLQAGGLTVPGVLNLNQGQWIDFGSNDTTKEGNAGKIGYSVFEDSLNIIGKGKPGEARRTTIWENVKMTGKISTNNLDPNNMPDGWGGGIRTFDLYSSGSIAAGPDGKQVKAFMNANGDIGGNSVNASHVNGHLVTGHDINARSDLNAAGSVNGHTINARGDLVVKGNIIFDGPVNKWIFHPPQDGRKLMHLTPMINGGWDWNRGGKWTY
jgi:hypothetical protein